MRRELDKQTLEIAIDRELSALRFHCENCRRLVRERAIGLALMQPIIQIEEKTFEEDLAFLAAFEVRVSVLA